MTNNVSRAVPTLNEIPNAPNTPAPKLRVLADSVATAAEAAQLPRPPVSLGFGQRSVSILTLHSGPIVERDLDSDLEEAEIEDDRHRPRGAAAGWRPHVVPHAVNPRSQNQSSSSSSCSASQGTPPETVNPQEIASLKRNLQEIVNKLRFSEGKITNYDLNLPLDPSLAFEMEASKTSCLNQLRAFTGQINSHQGDMQVLGCVIDFAKAYNAITKWQNHMGIASQIFSKKCPELMSVFEDPTSDVPAQRFSNSLESTNIQSSRARLSDFMEVSDPETSVAPSQLKPGVGSKRQASSTLEANPSKRAHVEAAPKSKELPRAGASDQPKAGQEKMAAKGSTHRRVTQAALAIEKSGEFKQLLKAKADLLEKFLSPEVRSKYTNSHKLKSACCQTKSDHVTSIFRKIFPILNDVQIEENAEEIFRLAIAFNEIGRIQLGAGATRTDYFVDIYPKVAQKIADFFFSSEERNTCPILESARKKSTAAERELSEVIPQHPGAPLQAQVQGNEDLFDLFPLSDPQMSGGSFGVSPSFLTDQMTDLLQDNSYLLPTPQASSQPVASSSSSSTTVTAQVQNQPKAGRKKTATRGSMSHRAADALESFRKAGDFKKLIQSRAHSLEKFLSPEVQSTYDIPFKLKLACSQTKADHVTSIFRNIFPILKDVQIEENAAEILRLAIAFNEIGKIQLGAGATRTDCFFDIFPEVANKVAEFLFSPEERNTCAILESSRKKSAAEERGSSSSTNVTAQVQNQPKVGRRKSAPKSSTSSRGTKAFLAIEKSGDFKGLIEAKANLLENFLSPEVQSEYEDSAKLIFACSERKTRLVNSIFAKIFPIMNDVEIQKNAKEILRLAIAFNEIGRIQLESGGHRTEYFFDVFPEIANKVARTLCPPGEQDQCPILLSAPKSNSRMKKQTARRKVPFKSVPTPSVAPLPIQTAHLLSSPPLASLHRQITGDSFLHLNGVPLLSEEEQDTFFASAPNPLQMSSISQQTSGMELSSSSSSLIAQDRDLSTVEKVSEELSKEIVMLLAIKQNFEEGTLTVAQGVESIEHSVRSFRSLQESMSHLGFVNFANDIRNFAKAYNELCSKPTLSMDSSFAKEFPEIPFYFQATDETVLEDLLTDDQFNNFILSGLIGE